MSPDQLLSESLLLKALLLGISLGMWLMLVILRLAEGDDDELD